MIFNILVEDADMEWVMIDATMIRAHQHSFGAKGGGKTKLRVFLRRLFNKNSCCLRVMHTEIRYGLF
jgi:hypothetical protein